MKEVAMKINQANLVRSLKFSFTNKTTVFGELMQNARRAHATHVVFEFAPETGTLRITDDGCGIDSIETLLTVAESGWDADVVAQEHPFGIGFLSALFACHHITVVSKSGRISVNTDDVLSFKPVTVSPVADWDGMTSIVMLGVELEWNAIKSTLERLAKGFPIPVLLNGEHLKRLFAMDSGLNFAQSDVGAMHLVGFDENGGDESSFDVYLQGLPIYKSYAYNAHVHIIHLDSSRFYARLPDRDQLVDESDVVKHVRDALKQEIEKRLMSLKGTLSAQDFVNYFEMMRQWGLLGLLNDVDVLPEQSVCMIDSYPVCDDDLYGSFKSELKELITRSDVENGKFELVDIDDDIQWDGAARFMFAWMRDAIIYKGNLDAGHWLYSHLRHLSGEEATIELVNESHGAVFEGEWTTVYVHFCDAYRIKIGSDVVEISGDAFFQGEEKAGSAVVPKADSSGFVLKQVSSYRSEFDDFQESTHESDVYAFSSFTIANTASDPADAIRRLLPDFSGCPSLFGKSFVVALDENGKVASVAAA